MTFDSRQQATLERATELALCYLGSLDSAHVGATAPLAELRRRFSRPLPDAGVNPPGASPPMPHCGSWDAAGWRTSSRAAAAVLTPS
jgi:hypothetical protein